MPSVRRQVVRLVRSTAQALRDVCHDYSRKGLSILAAALAFYLFLGLFPFLLVLIAATGYVLRSSQQGMELVQQVVGQALPGSSAQVQAQLQSVMAKRAIVGGLGLVGLVWSASGAFTILARALRLIWETPGRSLFLLARLRGLAAVAVAVVMLLVSVALTAAVSVLARLHLAGFGGTLGEVKALWQLASAALPVAISFVTFLALYRIVPAPQLKLRDLAAGAGFAAVAWEIAKRAFSYYLSHLANFTRVYGPVGAIVALLVWIYISAIIALVGAEVALVYAQRRTA